MWPWFWCYNESSREESSEFWSESWSLKVGGSFEVELGSGF